MTPGDDRARGKVSRGELSYEDIIGVGKSRVGVGKNDLQLAHAELESTQQTIKSHGSQTKKKHEVNQLWKDCDGCVKEFEEQKRSIELSMQGWLWSIQSQPPLKRKYNWLKML